MLNVVGGRCEPLFQAKRCIVLHTDRVQCLQNICVLHSGLRKGYIRLYLTVPIQVVFLEAYFGQREIFGQRDYSGILYLYTL